MGTWKFGIFYLSGLKYFILKWYNVIVKQVSDRDYCCENPIIAAFSLMIKERNYAILSSNIIYLTLECREMDCVVEAIFEAGYGRRDLCILGR